MKEFHYELTLFNAIFFIVLIIGCVYQVLDISYLYFSYKTNVNVRLEKESIVEIPAFSICTNVSQTIINEYLSQKFPKEINKTSSKWTQTKYLHHLPVREQLMSATISPEQMFNSCLVMKPMGFEDRMSDEYIDCRNLSEIRQYLTRDEKCFTILSQLNGENDNNFRIDHDMSVRDNGFLLFQIILNNRYLEGIYINFHSRWLPFEGIFSGRSPFMQIYNDKYSGYSFIYTKTTTQLMSSPYETHCYDYNLMGYKSHSDCIVDCKAQYFQNRYVRWHPYIPVSEDTQDWLYFGEKSIVMNKTFDKLMSDTCAQKCGKNDNCFDEYFETKIIEKWKNTEKVKNEEKLFEITVYLPIGMTVKYKHCPRIQLSEYLCFLASIVNLWFGISILTCSKFIFAIYYYLRRKKPKTGRRNHSSNHSNCYCFM